MDFKIGDRVRPSEKGIVERIYQNDRRGIVVGFSQFGDHLVRILVDGNKNSELFASKFWENEK